MTGRELTVTVPNAVPGKKQKLVGDIGKKWKILRVRPLYYAKNLVGMFAVYAGIFGNFVVYLGIFWYGTLRYSLEQTIECKKLVQ